MALSVLNNIPSLVAQNNLAVTSNNLQNTLFQLSSGSKINSGSDDPAGLSIVNGLQANISALTQSSQNATDGVGQLQVADGALSQVTTLLNRAVTLATEAANGGLTTAQFSAITNEYGSITSEINRIGQATNFNGTQVFSSVNAANPNQAVTTNNSSITAGSNLTAGQTTTVQLGNNTAYTYTAGGATASIIASASGGALTANTALVDGESVVIGNGTNNSAFVVDPLVYTGATTVTAATATTLNDNLTVVNGGGTTTYAGGAISTVAAWLTGFNAAGAANGVAATLNAAGKLVITSTTGITAVTPNAGNTTDFGALAETTEKVGDLINQINSTANGFTASLVGGNLNITSASGVVSLAAGNSLATTVGTLTATNTVQNLINGINSSGLGVTASLGNATNTNALVSANTVTAAGVLTAGSTVTLSSGTATNGVSPNTFIYTVAQNPDTVTGQSAAASLSVQNLIDAINTSGTPFHAYIDSTSHLEITDGSYSGNIAATGTLLGAGSPGAFSPQAQFQQLEVTDAQNRSNLAVQSNDAVLGYVANVGNNPLKGGNADAFVAPGTATGASGASVFISDGQVSNAFNTIKVAVGALSATQIGTNSTTLLSQNLGTASGASAALTVINNAISNVAAMRGTIGAGVNRLNSATNVINTQIQNLTSAQSSIQDANIGQVVANMSKYQVLEQTGISALAQANQNEQAVLKLLQ
jgi:flagellin